MKRILSLLLLAVLLASLPFTAASCGEQKPDAPSSGGTVGTTAAAETEPETTAERPGVTEADFKGATFTVLYPLWSLYRDFYFAEEANGDAVNDAIFERTSKLEESLNIDMTAVSVDSIADVQPTFGPTVLAGDDDYQLVLMHSNNSVSAVIAAGLVLNWHDIPGIDMTKSWWNQSQIEHMELNGILPMAANDFILPDVNSVFFNTKLLEAYDLEKPYALVESGVWTWDKLIEMGDKVSADLNGDSQFDAADQYGFVGEMSWQFASITTGADCYIITKNGEGRPEISILSERTVNLFDKLKAYFNNGTSAYVWEYNQKYDPNIGNKPPVSFDEGHALFYAVPLSLASSLRATEVDFGIVPYPKYDEAQEGYPSLNFAGNMCVPITVVDLDMLAAAVEMLGFLSGQTVMPAFYDVLLGQKISRDEESIRMLDIIFGSCTKDLGVTLAMHSITANALKKSAPPFASYYESNIKSWQKRLDDYYEAHLNFQ